MAEVAETSEETLTENEAPEGAEASEEVETTEATADEASSDAAETAEESADKAPEVGAEEGAEEGVEEAPEPVRPASPYDLEGDWYVIHSYSGYENKVKANLETRIKSMHMEDRIFEVHIPMEDVVEIKGGKKVTVPRKVFPGYILVRMRLDDDSWYAVRNTPGVTGFVGGNQKPTPLSRREVERFLGVQEEEEKAKPRFKPAWEVGEQVRVVAGPFADFNGVIEDINIDQQKVVVLVNIFGRDTPVELGFDDITKN
jgi:transcription termination/antitermination protein NusG